MPSTTLNYTAQTEALIQEAVDFLNDQEASLAAGFGQSSTPLTIKKWLAKFTRNEVLRLLLAKVAKADAAEAKVRREQIEQEVEIT